MTSASSAGQLGGNGRGFVRLAPLVLIAGLALIASLAFTSAASAADGPPVISPVTVDELGVHHGQSLRHGRKTETPYTAQ